MDSLKKSILGACGGISLESPKKADLEKKVEELTKENEYLRKLQGYSSADDLIRGEGLEMLRIIAYEAKHGKSSADKTRAAGQLADRSFGKVADRILNINADVQSMSEPELQSKIQELVKEVAASVGLNVKEPSRKLIIEDDE